MSSNKAVVFDLGNVLIDWNPRYLYSKIFPTETEVEWFLENICDEEWNAKHDAGQPFSTGIAELSSLHPQFSAQISNWYGRWEEMLGGQLDDTVEILAELKKKQVPLFILSNWSAETYPIAEATYDFLHWFDGKIISGEIGKIKPDPDIYKLLIETYDLIPDNTVFIDDKLANVKAAEDSGIHGIHFHNAALLRNELAKLKLL
ncbi:MAG: HAD family phosphatase [SAR324 cluster bacterium]|nr:HAD family phosphatase [SAR324 cluster bacterium]